jgi:hypothetical protein
MRILSAADLEGVIAAGVRAGQLRSSFATTTDKLILAINEQLDEHDQAAQQASDDDVHQFHSALMTLVDSSDGLINAHDMIAMMGSVRALSEAMLPPVEEALGELDRLSKVGIPSHMLPDGVKDAFEDASEKALNPTFSANSLLATSVQGIQPDTAEQFLAKWTFIRLWALHGVLLSSIAAATPSTTALSLDDIRDFRSEATSRMLQFRNRMHDIANEMNTSRLAGPASTARMWVFLDEMETWLVTQAAESISSAFAAATAHRNSGGQDALRSARDAAVAYDALRTLLALDSGARAILRAHSVHDEESVRQFGLSSTLSAVSATLDLPRSTLAEAAAVAQGTVVEIAGIVTNAEYVVGGPAPRSVLTLGPPAGTQIKVFVPFMAVNSFGIVEGIWIQARGQMFPQGKDDLTGPVLQTRRIRRQAASESSFTDQLIWAGRHEFEFRPGGVDIIGGRLAGEIGTCAELGLRR